MKRWLRLREKLERRKPLDTPDGRIVNLDAMPDGTIRRSLRDRRSKRGSVDASCPACDADRTDVTSEPFFSYEERCPSCGSDFMPTRMWTKPG